MNIYETLLAKAINGGGGSGGNAGYEYEIGTYTPSENIRHPSIPFKNTHDDAPVLYAIVGDVSETGYGENDVVSVVFFDNYHAMNEYYPDTAGNSTVYASIYQVYGNDTNYSSNARTNITNLSGSSNSTQLGYYVSNTAIKPDSGYSARKFKSTISYKWIAIWNHPAETPILHTYKFTGTINAPFSQSNFLRIKQASDDRAEITIRFDASALGYNAYLQQFWSEGSYLFTSGSDTDGMANAMRWSYENGLDYAYLFVGGQKTDMTPYASLVPSEVTVYSYFPIEGFAEYEVSAS